MRKRLSQLALMFYLIFSSISFAHALCVKGDDVVLRTGPGKNFPVSWKVNRHMPLLDVDSKAGWYKVEDLDGATHWVARSQVTNAYQCMAVQVSQATLRTGPGTDKPYDQNLPSVGKYYSFKRIDFDPPWYQVEDDKRGRYWVHENLVWRPMKRSRINF